MKDQAELIEFARTLESDIGALESALRDARQTVPPRQETSRDDLLEQTEQLEGQRAQLQILCNIAGLQVQLTPAKPQTQNRMTAPTTQPASASDRKPNFTEQVLASRGLTFAKWNSKQNQKPQPPAATGATAKLLASEGVESVEQLVQKRRSRPACHRGSPPED